MLFTDTLLDRSTADVRRLVSKGQIMLLNVTAFASPEELQLHVTLSRYFVFASWVKHYGLKHFDLVVHIDARDILFQQNFFASFYNIAANGHPEALQGVFSLGEEGAFKLDDISAGWIREVLPAAQAAALLEHLCQSKMDGMPVSVMNSGVVGGASAAYYDYLRAMVAVLGTLSPAARERYGIDQGVHIVLVTVGLRRANYPHPVLLLPWRVGPARHAFLPPSVIHRDGFGRPVNCNRIPYALLHQIDRFPSLMLDLRRPYLAALKEALTTSSVMSRNKKKGNSDHEVDDDITSSTEAMMLPLRRNSTWAGTITEKSLAAIDAKGGAVAELLAASRGGAFRYVRCLPSRMAQTVERFSSGGGGGDHEVSSHELSLVLLVMCARSLVLDTTEAFLRRAMERLPLCTTVVVVVAGGSSTALSRLALDYDGRFEAASTIFSESSTPLRIAHQWLVQRLSDDESEDSGLLDGRTRVVLGLDLDLAAVSVDILTAAGSGMGSSSSSLLPNTAVLSPEVLLLRSGSLIASGTAKRLVQVLSNVDEMAAAGASLTAPLPKCLTPSRWWKSVCWSTTAQALGAELRGPGKRLHVQFAKELTAAQWNVTHAMYRRHELEGDVSDGGVFKTIVTKWYT
jgi:hypothetical protein